MTLNVSSILLWVKGSGLVACCFQSKSLLHTLVKFPRKEEGIKYTLQI